MQEQVGVGGVSSLVWILVCGQTSTSANPRGEREKKNPIIKEEREGEQRQEERERGEGARHQSSNLCGCGGGV
jgi:hypothetical protein